MFLKFLWIEFIIMTSTYVVGAPVDIQEKDISSTEILDYTDKLNGMTASKHLCLLANLKVLPILDATMRTIAVTFEPTDKKFKDCFKFYDIVLTKYKKEVRKIKIPFDYKVTESASYTFENLTCGLYELTIRPWFNNLLEALLIITYKKPLNMSSIDCNRILPKSISLNNSMNQSADFYTVILIVCVVIMMLIVGGLTCYRYKSVLWKRRRENPFQRNSDTKQILENAGYLAEKIEVFIINHYDPTTLKQVKYLKDILTRNIPNLDVILIEDGLTVSLIVGSIWLNNQLDRKNANNVIKKIIVIDSVGKIDSFQNENENENNIFYEAIKKLSHDWSRNIDDYDNLFVVDFNNSSTKLKELEYVVKQVRYCVPDHLIILCRNLVHGSQMNPCEIEKNLSNLSFQDPIKNCIPL